jgi:hypothetical protein
MKATCSSETSVDSQRITRPYIPEDISVHNHRCENLTSYGLCFIWHWNLIREAIFLVQQIAGYLRWSYNDHLLRQVSCVVVSFLQHICTDWVAEETFGCLPLSLSLSLSPPTALATPASYYKMWSAPYSSSNLEEGYFHTSSREKCVVVVLHQHETIYSITLI